MEKFEVNDFVDNEDGSSTITITMDYESILMFARKGILSTLIEAADEVLENNIPIADLTNEIDCNEEKN